MEGFVQKYQQPTRNRTNTNEANSEGVFEEDMDEEAAEVDNADESSTEWTRQQ